MFQKDEQANCPVCGMSLVAFEKLPASADAAGDALPVEPEDELLPRAYLGRGRGAGPHAGVGVSVNLDLAVPRRGCDRRSERRRGVLGRSSRGPERRTATPFVALS